VPRGEGRRPAGDHVAFGEYVPQSVHDNHGVECEVDAHQGDRDADGLQEACPSRRRAAAPAWMEPCPFGLWADTGFLAATAGALVGLGVWRFARRDINT
jgi:hypothetical protein